MPKEFPKIENSRVSLRCLGSGYVENHWVLLKSTSFLGVITGLQWATLSSPERNCNSCTILLVLGLTMTPPLCDWLGMNIAITT